MVRKETSPNTGVNTYAEYILFRESRPPQTAKPSAEFLQMSCTHLSVRTSLSKVHITLSPSQILPLSWTVLGRGANLSFLFLGFLFPTFVLWLCVPRYWVPQPTPRFLCPLTSRQKQLTAPAAQLIGERSRYFPKQPALGSCYFPTQPNSYKILWDHSSLQTKRWYLLLIGLVLFGSLISTSPS